MTLLRFRLQNHKSFKDQAELSMLHSDMRSARPTEGSWQDNTYRTAGIYGPNASGKSSILDALDFMIDVVRDSATVWRNSRHLPYQPFRLDEVSRNEPSHYALDFTLDDVRYEYGFSISSRRIHSEWLYDYPLGRQRLLFERGSTREETRFGRALVGGTATLQKLTTPRELLLSRAANDQHPLLAPVQAALVEGFEFAQFSEGSREQRLRDIAEGVAKGAISIEDIILLLQVADVGIAQVDIAEQKAPPELLEFVKAIQKAGNESLSSWVDPKEGDTDPDRPFSVTLGGFEEVRRYLEFQHFGEEGKRFTLTPDDQSTGTLSWLSLAVPAVDALRNGTVLLIDEIDASLHPQLAEVLIQMFKEERLNSHGAQLIFTTHDTYFLSPSADVPLSPEEVWFVEKNGSGVSDLYSLGDFSTRRDQNLSRRYLHGRYGATPQVAPAFLDQLVASGSEDE